MNTIVVEFAFERETRNAYRYREVGSNPRVGTLYVFKSTFDDTFPRSLTVTITESGDSKK